MVVAQYIPSKMNGGKVVSWGWYIDPNTHCMLIGHQIFFLKSSVKIPQPLHQYQLFFFASLGIYFQEGWGQYC